VEWYASGLYAIEYPPLRCSGKTSVTERYPDTSRNEIAIAFDEATGTVCLSLTGRLTARSVISAIEKLEAHPEFSPERPRLWDVRQADLSKLSRDEFGRIARAARESHLSRPGVRVAVLVSRDVDFGMARMFELTEGSSLLASMAVFRDEAAAMAWLGMTLG